LRGWITIVNIIFNSPVYLWLILGIFLVILTRFVNVGWSRKKGLGFANYALIEKVAKQKLIPRSNFLFIIKLIILILIILALADMVIWYDGFGVNSDVVIAIDSSASMLADDFNPSRLEVAKSTAIDIISRLDGDIKVGIVSFAGTSLITQVPTRDRIALRERISSIEMIRTGGTGIGEAILLGSSLLALQESTRGKTLILITDGQNTVGIGTDDASNYANDRGVVIHTIGIATEEGGRFAGASAVSQLDSATLSNIAESTGGDFYFSQSEEELEGALLNIFTSETKKIGIHARIHLLLLAVILFFIEWILANTRYRLVP